MESKIKTYILFTYYYCETGRLMTVRETWQSLIVTLGISSLVDHQRRLLASLPGGCCIFSETSERGTSVVGASGFLMPWPPFTNSRGVSSGRPSLCCKMDTLTCSGTSRCAADKIKPLYSSLNLFVISTKLISKRTEWAANSVLTYSGSKLYQRSSSDEASNLLMENSGLTKDMQESRKIRKNVN